MPKTHLPHPTKPNAALCGARTLVTRDGRRRPAPVFIPKNAIVDTATCRSCQRADDALQIRDYLRACAEAGIDPDTMEKIPMTDPAFYRPSPEAHDRATGRLRLFYNGHDYVIASSEGDAAASIALHFGEGSPESVRADQLGQWDLLANDEQVPLTMVGSKLSELNAPGSEVVLHSASVWVTLFGPGYLASSKES